MKNEHPTARDVKLLTDYVPLSVFLVLEKSLVTFVESVNEKNAERNARIKMLETRLAELESSHAVLNEKALKGGGPWQRGVTYAVNDCVQHDGGLWKCVETHVSGASFSHEHFLLQIKRGRDGKDAAR